MPSDRETNRLRWPLGVGVVVLGVLGYALATRDCGAGSAPSPPDANTADELLNGASQTREPSRSDPAELHDGGPVLDRAKADRMRAAILKALASQPEDPSAGGAAGHAAPSSGGAYPEMPSNESGDGGALRDYIKSVIHDQYFPLAKQCYEASLAKDPKVHGRIALAFDIVGDTKIGGVVDNAEYDDEQTTIIDPELRTCLRESMMSVSFDAPPKSGKVTVKYPISFAPDTPDE